VVKVKVQNRGFLRAQLEYLHHGVPLPRALVPLFDLYFGPRTTVAEFRGRIAALVGTTPDLVEVLVPDEGTGAPDDRFVREWWGSGFRERHPLQFRALVPDKNPTLDAEAYRMYFTSYVRQKSLGSGTFGTAWLAVDPATGETIALKIVRVQDKNKHEFRKTRDFREIHALIQFNHPCILSIIGWDWHEEKFLIGTEFVENGSLDGILNARRAGAPTPKWFDDTGIAIIIVGIVLGMRHIHMRNAMHRDFKPANVLLDNRGHPLIADFGMCRDINAEILLTGTIGTPAYSAPEVLGSLYESGEPYDHRVDVYAFASVLFELIVGDQAFTGAISAVNKKISEGVTPPIPSDVLPLTQGIIEDCWARERSLRPSFDDVLGRLRSEEFRVLPGVDVEKVKAYVAEIEGLEAACLMTPLPNAGPQDLRRPIDDGDE
jgi:serine/threonine protein kinase